MKIDLSNNNSAIAEEEARRQQEIDNDIQSHDKERDYKIMMRRRKQKIVYRVCAGVLIFTFVFFVGAFIYSNFIKKSVSEDRMKYWAYAYSQEFPKENLEG